MRYARRRSRESLGVDVVRITRKRVRVQRNVRVYIHNIILSYTRAHARRGRVIKRAPRAERGSGDGRLPARPPSEPARARALALLRAPRRMLTYRCVHMYIYYTRCVCVCARDVVTRRAIDCVQGGGVVVAIHTNRRRRVRDAKPVDAGRRASDRRRVDDGAARVHGGWTRALFMRPRV